MRSSTLRLRAITVVLVAIFGEAALAADTSTTNLVLLGARHQGISGARPNVLTFLTTGVRESLNRWAWHPKMAPKK
jgi:hypothetical protein